MSPRPAGDTPGTTPAVLWILAGAALLRVGYLVQVWWHPPMWDFHPLDSELYLEAARGIVDGSWRGASEAYSLSPLYFNLLAALHFVFGDSRAPIYLLQQALGLGTIALTARLAGRVYGESAAVGAALLAALYAPLALMEVKLMASTVAVFTSLLALTLLQRAREEESKRLALLGGFALGITCLARPNTLLFAPLGALWLVWPRADRRLRSAVTALFVVGLVLAVAPITARNYRVERSLVLISSQAGITFYQANNPQATGSYSVVPGLSGNVRDQSREAREVAERARGRPLTRTEVDRYWLAQGLSYLADHPADALQLLGRKVVLWLGSAEISTEYSLRTERRITWLLRAMPLPFGAILALAALGVACGPRTRGTWLLCAFVAANGLSVAIFYFSSRYRLPAVPPLCILAGGGCVVALERLRAAGPARRLAPLAAAGILAIASLAVGRSLDAQQSAIEFYNLGVASSRNEDWGATAHYLERALSTHPDRWQIHLRLGDAYERLGRHDDAVTAYTRVLQLDPDRASVLERLRRAKRAGADARAVAPR